MLGLIRNPSVVWRYVRGQELSEFRPHEFARFVSANAPVIIEAGAYDGRDTEIFCRLWPAARIFAFEPLPELARGLEAKFVNEKQIAVIPKALVGDGADSVVLNSFAEDEVRHASSSILEPGEHLELAPTIHFGRQISVPAISLDRFIAEYQLDRIDLLWLDLQGAEAMVLADAYEALKRTSVIHIEVSRRPLYQGATTLSEIRSLLAAHGFEMVLVRAPFVMGNAIFIRKSTRDR